MSIIIGDIEESDLPIHFDIVYFQAISPKMQEETNKDGVIWKQQSAKPL